MFRIAVSTSKQQYMQLLKDCTKSTERLARGFSWWQVGFVTFRSGFNAIWYRNRTPWSSFQIIQKQCDQFESQRPPEKYLA